MKLLKGVGERFFLSISRKSKGCKQHPDRERGTLGKRPLSNLCGGAQKSLEQILTEKVRKI